MAIFQHPASPTELVKGRSLWQDALRRLLKNRMALLGGLITLVIAGSAGFASWIVPIDPTYQETHHGATPPGTRHDVVPTRLLLVEGKETVYPPPRLRLAGRRQFEFRIRRFLQKDVRVLVASKSKQVKKIQLTSLAGEEDVERVAVTGRLERFRTDQQPPREFFDLSIEKGRPLPQILRPFLGEPKGWAGRQLLFMQRRELAREPQVLRLALDGQTVRGLTLDGKPVKAYDLQGRLVTEAQRNGRRFTHTHLLGQDHLGRDLLARVIFGGQISFMIGVIATVVSLLIGVFYGSISAYAGGRVDELMMRVVDILYGLPYMFLVIILMVTFGREIKVMFLALGAVQWLTMARIVRGQMLSLKEKEYIEAARASGGSGLWIITRHLIPNTLGVIAVYTTLTIPSVILQESFLSFIGLSVELEGQALESWGALTWNGISALGAGGQNWWLLLFPACTLGITLFSLNFLGDGLRDAFDPQMKGRS